MSSALNNVEGPFCLRNNMYLSGSKSLRDTKNNANLFRETHVRMDTRNDCRPTVFMAHIVLF
jgi:hypothetical protein